jgi:peptidyl-prolyl cis-trans isomerase SurA
VAVVLIAALAVDAARAEITNRIVATIDGEPITAHEVRRYAKDRKAEGMSEAEVLEVLITDRLLEKEIKTLGIAARDEEIARYIEEIRTRNGMDEARFREALATQGITWEAYRARVKAEIEKAQLVNREIRQRVNVSPEEIQRYYDAHRDDYAIRDRVKVRDIFFAFEPGSDEAAIERVRAKAEEVRALAAEGRDFAKLAKQFSEGPGADKGGELGTFGRGDMEQAFEDVVFALKPGEVSQPVKTAEGYHLLRVDEVIAAGHKPLADVRDDIRETLYDQALEERYKSWLERDLRERHHVEVLN